MLGRTPGNPLPSPGDGDPNEGKGSILYSCDGVKFTAEVPLIDDNEGQWLVDDNEEIHIVKG